MQLKIKTQINVPVCIEKTEIKISQKLNGSIKREKEKENFRSVDCCKKCEKGDREKN